MPTNSPSKSKAQETRHITKSRLIAGLVAEMDAAEAVILLEPMTDLECGLSARIACDFRFPFETSSMRIVDATVPLGDYRATALFAGQRILFIARIIDSSGHFAFPTYVDVQDLRTSKRRRFGAEIQGVEIASKHAVVMATPIDISHESLAVLLEGEDCPLHEGDPVDVKVRGAASSRDIFSSAMIVRAIQRQEKATRILLTNKVANTSTKRRTDRQRPGFEASVTLTPCDEHLGCTTTCSIVDISATGFRGELRGGLQEDWLAIGMQTRINDEALFATVIWREGHQIGLRLDSLDHAETLTQWCQILDQFAHHGPAHHSQVDDLIHLLTATGLLKGGRRKMLGQKAGKFLPPQTVLSNPMLYRRISLRGETGHFYANLGMVRLTDNFWCMQEGAHTGDHGLTYRDLFAAIPHMAKEIYASSVLAPRYIGGIYQQAVKSSAEFVLSFLDDKANAEFNVTQCGISHQLALPFNPHPVTTFNLTDLGARALREVVNQFDPVLYDVFGGWNGSHPRINAELTKLGPLHGARTVGLASGDKIWGLAYRLRSYYTLSVTGVVNSLFLIVNHQASRDDILNGLQTLAHQGFSFGTNDVAIVYDHHQDLLFEIKNSLHEVRNFALYIIDNHLNRERLGLAHEEQDFSALRKLQRLS